MAVTYRGTTLPNARTQWGAPGLASKRWAFNGTDGESSMHGGTRGRASSVSGICLVSFNTTMEGWLDGVVGDLINDDGTFSNTLALSPTYGERFTNAADGLLYNHYVISFYQLRV